MKRFYIADIHFFHPRIIDECNRPYKSLKEMHNDIILQWNRKVGKNDMVYILGDVASISKEEDMVDMINILKVLNGKKILIVGNHDRESIKNFKFRKCFVDIKDYCRVYDEGRKVVLLHFPMEFWEGDKKGVIHLHGHTHKDSINKKPNRYNVGVDVMGYVPKTLTEIINNKYN